MVADRMREPQRARVNFVRLLRSCDALAEDLALEDNRRRLGAYVGLLRTLLASLERTAECSRDDVNEYTRKVAHIAELLDASRLTSASAGALARARAHNNARISRGEANAELSNRLVSATRVQQERREALMRHGVGDTDGSDSVPSEASLRPPVASSAVVSAAAAAAPTGGGGCSGSQSGGSVLDELVAAAAAERSAAAAAEAAADGGGSSGGGGGGGGGGGPSAERVEAAAASAESAPPDGEGRPTGGGVARSGEAVAAQSVDQALAVEEAAQESRARTHVRRRQCKDASVTRSRPSPVGAHPRRRVRHVEPAARPVRGGAAAGAGGPGDAAGPGERGGEKQGGARRKQREVARADRQNADLQVPNLAHGPPRLPDVRRHVPRHEALPQAAAVPGAPGIERETERERDSAA